jgi:hypothetical protein
VPSGDPAVAGRRLRAEAGVKLDPIVVETFLSLPREANVDAPAA